MQSRGSTKERVYKKISKDVAGHGQEPDPDESEAIRIPLSIDDKMVVRAIAGSMRMATCRVVGGCRLALNQHVPMTKGSSVSLTFRLPNEAIVTELEAVAATVNRAGKTTKTGLSFTAQGGVISRIAEFCEFCRFFSVA